MIELLIWIIVLCVVAGIVWWIVSLLPLPAPFKTIAQVCVLLIFLVILLLEFLPLAHLHHLE